MKEKIFGRLTKPYVVVVVMALAPVFALADRNFGYFFGLGVALLILWSSGMDWSRFGLGEKLSKRTILKALLFAVLIFIVIDICIQPFLEIYFGQIDLSSVEDIRGDLVNFLILMVIMWVFAAFGEEFLFSGYYMKHLAEFFGSSDKAWLGSAFILSIYFGASHNYQGTAGMIAVGLASAFYFFTFYKNRTNLALLIFMHGFYDSIGLTLIYFNQDKVFFNLVSRLLDS
jgi:membrane protease YdiL (CAAX protease family)